MLSDMGDVFGKVRSAGGAHRIGDVDPIVDVERIGIEHGIITRGALNRLGYSDATIRSLLATERIARLRTGWFALAGADPVVGGAVRGGGGLTCVSVLSRLNVWLPESAAGAVHIRVSRHARRMRPVAPSGVRYCAVGEGIDPLVDDPEAATRAAADCLHGADLVEVFDSLLNKRVFQPDQLLRLFPDPPRRLQRALAVMDGSADSGTETRIRLHMRTQRIPHRTQVFIPTVGTVDFLVGKSLIVEADSNRHHGGEQIDEDHDRDIRSANLGLVTLRASYEQIYRRFSTFAGALSTWLKLGLHELPTGICL
jgi:very-short-patch-repair endonuclease